MALSQRFKPYGLVPAFLSKRSLAVLFVVSLSACQTVVID
ncbi:hypothetical protein OURE66S_01628 [Oligella ureolytica]